MNCITYCCYLNNTIYTGTVNRSIISMTLKKHINIFSTFYLLLALHINHHNRPIFHELLNNGTTLLTLLILHKVGIIFAILIFSLYSELIMNLLQNDLF